MLGAYLIKIRLGGGVKEEGKIAALWAWELSYPSSPKYFIHLQFIFELLKLRYVSKEQVY